MGGGWSFEFIQGRISVVMFGEFLIFIYLVWITHLGRTGHIAVGWLRHILFYEPVPDAF